MDGASKRGGHGAGCGGVFRDLTDKWILGFGLQLEDMGSLSAELWSILKGLELAWERRFRRLVVESDSRETIDLIGRRRVTTHPLDPLIQQVLNFVNKDWEVMFKHTYREGNKAAHRLALSARESEYGWSVMETPPEEVRLLLQKDLKLVRERRDTGLSG